MPTPTEVFWNQNTVLSSHKPFTSAAESLAWLEHRFSMYRLFREYMDLWGQHAGEVVLDYGCGPANDVVGFAEFSGAQKVYGVDVSARALADARERLALHSFPQGRCELVLVDDAPKPLPFPDNSIDHIYSQGVLHHTEHHAFIIKEFNRILKPGKTARIMVYNRDSIWFHYHVGVDFLLRSKAAIGKIAEQVAGLTTDGPDCPLAIFFRPDDFLKICRDAGFGAEFLGGYYSLYDKTCFTKYGTTIKDNTLINPEHREFARGLLFDRDGYALYRGKPCGIGGSYLLSKPC